MGCLYVVLVLAGLFLLGNVIWLVLIRETLPRKGILPTAWVHIDGTLEDGSILEPHINIWKNYQTRSWLCGLEHGTCVQMVRRVGDGVEIICPSGERGWVTYWFIEELKYPLPASGW